MKYRKKPVVIEAKQLLNTKESFNEIYEWLGMNVDLSAAQDGTFINIATLEGTMQARIGDWIIKGIAGEFYPCKNDIFLATYEKVE